MNRARGFDWRDLDQPTHVSAKPVEYRGLGQPRPIPARVRCPSARLPAHLRAHELFLLRLLERGLSLKEAAADMGITYGCAKIYLANARQRMGARTTAQLIAWDMQQTEETA